jgi:hypothetical protein
MEYTEYIAEIEQKWPLEKNLRETLLDMLRDACAWHKSKRLEIEGSNAEARRRGVSYQERKRATEQIAVLDAAFQKLRARGIAYSRECPPLHELIRPEDMPYIEGFGLENHLKSVVTWTL